jgi:putative ABC transport system permease protein
VGAFWNDLRYGWRMLQKKPGFTLLAVGILGLGIGASTALFSVIKGALLDPWPYAAFDRIVTFSGSYPKLAQDRLGEWSVPEYLAISKQTDVFEYVIAGTTRNMNLTGAGDPQRILGAAMTANAFAMLGVKPMLGRTFLPQEDRPGADRVVVMSYALWNGHFHADPRMAGRVIQLGDESYTVLGVMPRDFLWWGRDLWFPLGLDVTNSNREQRSIAVQARLRPGVSLAQAESALETFARQADREYSAQFHEYAGWHIHLTVLVEDVLRNVREALYVLWGAVGLLLLIATANVANLLLARSTVREKEIATRIALGANRGRVVQQLLTESVLLALVGGALGTLLAGWSTRLIVELIPYGYIPAEAHVKLDLGVLAFTLGVTTLAGLLFGLAPAMQVFKTDLHATLKEGGRRSVGEFGGRNFRNKLAALEIGLAFLVLASALLLVKSFSRLTDSDLGFQSEQVVTMRLALPQNRYPQDMQSRIFFEELVHRMEGIPGVEAAGAATDLPLGPIETTGFAIEGKSADELGAIFDADSVIACGRYFATMKIPVLDGREFSEQDADTSPHVVVINQTMARRFWPSESPLGKRIRLQGAGRDAPWITIIGVVKDVRQESLESGTRQAIFIPSTQAPSPPRNMALVVRSKADPATVTGAVRREITAMDAALPLYAIETLDQRVVDSLGGRRLAMTMMSVLGVLALVLSVAGLYGVLAYSVAQRTSEFGIRMALGAQPRDVHAMVLRQGMKIAATGLAAGAACFLVSSRILAHFLYRVSPSDPATIAGVGLLLMGVAFVACYVPAQRATQVEPITALRHE